jgi:hypothetical protein
MKVRVNGSESGEINRTNNIFLYISVDPLNNLEKLPGRGIKGTNKVRKRNYAYQDQ